MPDFRTVAVARGTVIQAVTATGDIQPVSTVEVGSQISGLVREVFVDFNDPVTEGQVLAKIDPATFESRLRQTEAELVNTRANYDLVKLNADRILSLFERNLVSQQELDQVRAQLSQAEAQLLIRTAAVETARVDVDRCTITSPITGTVLSRQIVAGKTVAASLNAPVLFVLVDDLRRMQIQAAISEADIGAVAVGQTVNFTVDAYPARRFQGVVRQIRNTPVREQNVISYTTIIDVSNDDLRLKPGMTANVAVVIQQRDRALVAPNAALRTRIPDNLKVVTAVVAGSETAVGPTLAPEEAMRALLEEVGHTTGRPTSAVMARVRVLAEERGITLPERRGGRGGAAAGETTVTTRTLYRLGGTETSPVIEAVSVRLGITDGSVTEVISGLEEGDRLITAVVGPEEASAGPMNLPFGGPTSGGGGGGRR